jgi:hypothetical protein
LKKEREEKRKAKKKGGKEIKEKKLEIEDNVIKYEVITSLMPL